MDEITAGIIKGVIKAGVDIWAQRTGKPPGWKPTAEDWDTLEDLPEIEALKQRGRDRVAGQS